jgi:hypothetical protein
MYKDFAKQLGVLNASNNQFNFRMLPARIQIVGIARTKIVQYRNACPSLPQGTRDAGANKSRPASDQHFHG